MKKIIALGCALALASLSSCGTNVSPEGVSSSSTNTPKTETPKYETNQKETPATKFCVKNGGEVSFETKENGMELAFCTINGEKKDAWAYMSEETSATGETETGSMQ
ncbi:hypothetical protein CSB09_03005 [Candidatus Gracilibacteria bacterium]|nr:MAG: hypothetical protein CSB09_03005 [Candidatus Gracilibacteria bacterium]